MYYAAVVLGQMAACKAELAAMCLLLGQMAGMSVAGPQRATHEQGLHQPTFPPL